MPDKRIDDSTEKPKVNFQGLSQIAECDNTETEHSSETMDWKFSKFSRQQENFVWPYFLISIFLYNTDLGILLLTFIANGYIMLYTGL
jgi:hypothetical protein